MTLTGSSKCGDTGPSESSWSSSRSHCQVPCDPASPASKPVIFNLMENTDLVRLHLALGAWSGCLPPGVPPGPSQRPLLLRTSEQVMGSVTWQLLTHESSPIRTGVYSLPSYWPPALSSGVILVTFGCPRHEPSAPPPPPQPYK